MRIKFVAGMGPIVRDKAASLTFYRDVLGLPLVGDDYVAADNLDGLKHFGQWAVEDAAEAIFGKREWPADVPLPQANLEFDVESPEAVAEAAREIEAAGYPILVGPKKELITISYTPWLHEAKA